MHVFSQYGGKGRTFNLLKQNSFGKVNLEKGEGRKLYDLKWAENKEKRVFRAAQYQGIPWSALRTRVAPGTYRTAAL